MIDLLSVLEPEYYLIILFLGIFLLTHFLLPKIRNVSFKLGYLDKPDHRSSHTEIVPTFGGVSFYIGLVLIMFVFQSIDADGVIITLMASMSIMFFTGLKDDLHNISPKMKFLAQFVAIGLILFHHELRITSFYGLFGVYELYPFFSVLLSAFVLIGLVNAYNLIDGIDGMASIVGIVAATSLGLMFYNLGMYFYLVLCVALVGMLFSFLRYNFSSKKKIFMGDTGSLLVGLVLGVLAMRLLSLGFDTVSLIAITRSEIPLLLLCVLIIPAFDVSRVIFIRFSKNMPVFSPDRNHIHHILIDAGLTHKKASILVGVINAVIIVAMYYAVRFFGIFGGLSLLLTLLLLLIYSFFVLDTKFQTKRVKVKIRLLLYVVYSKFFMKKKYEKIAKKSRVLFNKKLKAIRIFFF